MSITAQATPSTRPCKRQIACVAAAEGGIAKVSRNLPQIIQVSVMKIQRLATTWFPQIAKNRDVIDETHPLYQRVDDGYNILCHSQYQPYDPSACFIALGREELPLAFISIDTDKEHNRMEITTLCANPDRIIGKGESGGASALIGHAKQLAIRCNFSSMRLESTSSAELFYQSQGFEEDDDEILVIDFPEKKTPPEIEIEPVQEVYQPEKLSIICFDNLPEILENLKELTEDQKVTLECLRKDLRNRSLMAQLAGICDEDGRFYTFASLDVINPKIIQVIRELDLTVNKTGSHKLLKMLEKYAEECRRDLIQIEV